MVVLRTLLKAKAAYPESLKKSSEIKLKRESSNRDALLVFVKDGKFDVIERHLDPSYQFMRSLTLDLVHGSLTVFSRTFDGLEKVHNIEKFVKDAKMFMKGSYIHQIMGWNNKRIIEEAQKLRVNLN